MILNFNRSNIFLWGTFFKFLIFTALNTFFILTLSSYWIFNFSGSRSWRTPTIVCWRIRNNFESISEFTTWWVSAFAAAFTTLNIFILTCSYSGLALEWLYKEFCVSIFFYSWWLMFTMRTCGCNYSSPDFFCQVKESPLWGSGANQFNVTFNYIAENIFKVLFIIFFSFVNRVFKFRNKVRQINIINIKLEMSFSLFFDAWFESQHALHVTKTLIWKQSDCFRRI